MFGQALGAMGGMMGGMAPSPMSQRPGMPQQKPSMMSGMRGPQMRNPMNPGMGQMGQGAMGPSQQMMGRMMGSKMGPPMQGMEKPSVEPYRPQEAPEVVPGGGEMADPRMEQLMGMYGGRNPMQTSMRDPRMRNFR